MTLLIIAIVGLVVEGCFLGWLADRISTRNHELRMSDRMNRWKRETRG
jgi:hypothetical protein